MERTGRPRDPHIDAAVLDATVEVLDEVGYARLTLEMVARHAGTSKPSIYRRWPDRQHLVLAALERQLGEPRPPDSGCVVCDLVAGAGVFLTACKRMPAGVLGSLLADCAGRPELRTEFMARLFAPPRRAVGDAVDRARARGELRADLDRELAVDLIGSLVHYRALFGHAPADTPAMAVAVTTLLRGMAATRIRDHGHDLGDLRTGMTN
jgi:AcrR family transcriptional regulator